VSAADVSSTPSVINIHGRPSPTNETASVLIDAMSGVLNTFSKDLSNIQTVAGIVAHRNSLLTKQREFRLLQAQTQDLVLKEFLANEINLIAKEIEECDIQCRQTLRCRNNEE
jgi:protein subunit release factor A